MEASYTGAGLIQARPGGLRETGTLTVERQPSTRSALQVIGHAVAINLLNSKLSIFFFAFLPQFVSATEPRALARMLVVALGAKLARAER